MSGALKVSYIRLSNRKKLDEDDNKDEYEGDGDESKDEADEEYNTSTVFTFEKSAADDHVALLR